MKSVLFSVSLKYEMNKWSIFSADTVQNAKDGASNAMNKAGEAVNKAGEAAG